MITNHTNRIIRKDQRKDLRANLKLIRKKIIGGSVRVLKSKIKKYEAGQSLVVTRKNIGNR